MRRLLNLAEKVCRQGSASWIDTFCRPVGESYQEYRRIAFNRMHSVYSKANAVMAIDKQLTDDPVDHPFTRQFALLTCDWMFRLWTLQEAILPGPEKVYLDYGKI